MKSDVKLELTDESGNTISQNSTQENPKTQEDLEMEEKMRISAPSSGPGRPGLEAPGQQSATTQQFKREKKDRK